MDLPEVGDRVWVCDGKDGLPAEILASPYGSVPVRMARLRHGPSRVLDRRGGVPRWGSNGKPLPPALVEFQVSGSAYWFPWFQLMPDVPHHPRLGRQGW